MDDTIQLAHGEGGRKQKALLDEVLLKHFRSKYLVALPDAATLAVSCTPRQRLVFTTDGHVVDPLFFPGGDIGCLSVFGTVNDLAVCGAMPRFISFSLILEEGLPIATLDRICQTAANSADECAVEIVTGDTKVVPRGMADRLFITTAGVGFVEESTALSPTLICPGDRIIVSGSIGRHGATIMAARLGLNISGDILSSDLGPLTEVCQTALRSGGVRVMRDATRGGVATVLHEFMQACSLPFVIEEESIPITPAVVDMCELLGIEPVYLANEGTAVIVTSPDSAADVINALHSTVSGKNATVIGTVLDGPQIRLLLRTKFGTHRILTIPSGQQFPRIC